MNTTERGLKSCHRDTCFTCGALKKCIAGYVIIFILSAFFVLSLLFSHSFVLWMLYCLFVHFTTTKKDAYLSGLTELSVIKMEVNTSQIVQNCVIEIITATRDSTSSSSESSSDTSLDSFAISSLELSSSTSLSSSTDSLSASPDENDAENGHPRVSIRDFVEITVPSYSAREFRRHFRLSRNTTDDLVELFRRSAFLPVHANGPVKVTHETAFLMTLWYLANIETFRQCSDRFDVSCSSAHRVLKKTLNFINSLCSRYISWPDRNEAMEIKRRFRLRNNIDGIIGCIDGCHIEIRRPMDDEDAYVNRNGFHSIILQGIVDSRKRFIDIYVGEPGSMHDARVLRRSPIYKQALEDIDTLHGCFLLGDRAYPNLSWLVPSFKDRGNLSREQILFNIRHSSNRICIEHAFGLLKTVFRRLLRFDNISMKIIVDCVMAACILHNVLLRERADDYIYEANVVVEEGEEDVPNDLIIDRRADVFNSMFNR